MESGTDRLSVQDAWKLMLKLLQVVFLTKNGTKGSHDKILFDAPVSSETFLNPGKKTTSLF